MVPRYARPAMTALWEPEAKYRIWFEIEAHATQKLADLGVVPQSAAKALWDWWATDPKIDVDAIDAIEAVTKHDVIAFLTWVAEQVGDEARFMHQGMTSSDVLDTTLAVQLARAADILLEDLDALLAAIKRRALEHKYTPTIGRSHGIHAEPTTFGLKLAQAYAEFDRCRARLKAARLQQGLEIEALARELKNPRAVLEGIERGDFAHAGRHIEPPIGIACAAAIDRVRAITLNLEALAPAGRSGLRVERVDHAIGVHHVQLTAANHRRCRQPLLLGR